MLLMMLLQVRPWNQPDLLLTSTDLRKWHRVAVQSHFNKGTLHFLVVVVPRLFKRPHGEAAVSVDLARLVSGTACSRVHAAIRTHLLREALDPI